MNILVNTQLPPVKGRYSFNTTFSKLTWFKTGGPISVFYKPLDINDLQYFLINKPPELKTMCIGAGSNVLAQDDPFDGCVVKLNNFNHIKVENDLLILGAGCLDRTVALTTIELGLTGLEFLIGVPGTIGGNICMNAGAYKQEIKDTLKWVEYLTLDGVLARADAAMLGMQYRSCNLPKGVIITQAAFKCERDLGCNIEKRITEFLHKKQLSQPVTGRTGGSTFKNPKAHVTNKKAWQLIDEAGCRGMRINDAQISPKHCNFLINLGNATALDLQNLINIVKHKVLAQSGVELELEIIIIY